MLDVYYIKFYYYEHRVKYLKIKCHFGQGQGLHINSSSPGGKAGTQVVGSNLGRDSVAIFTFIHDA